MIPVIVLLSFFSLCIGFGHISEQYRSKQLFTSPMDWIVFFGCLVQPTLVILHFLT